MLNGKLISLVSYTRERCHALFRAYEADPMMTETPFLYDEQKINAYFAAKTGDPARRIFAIEHQGAVIGELQLKRIEAENKTCTMSIVLANDAVKNKGFGTEAEKLAIRYAFGELRMNAVYADTTARNTRSKHVLEKLGFHHTHDENGMCFFVLHKGASCEDMLL
jgi:RimJ/RimL family protein N-acetyltransferase